MALRRPRRNSILCRWIGTRRRVRLATSTGALLFQLLIISENRVPRHGETQSLIRWLAYRIGNKMSRHRRGFGFPIDSEYQGRRPSSDEFSKSLAQFLSRSQPAIGNRCEYPGYPAGHIDRNAGPQNSDFPGSSSSSLSPPSLAAHRRCSPNRIMPLCLRTASDDSVIQPR